MAGSPRPAASVSAREAEVESASATICSSALRGAACEDASMSTGGGPGAGDLFNPNDLDDVLNRVVMPVVTSLISADELETVEVGWGPFSRKLSEIGQSIGWDSDLWVRVVASGRTLEWQLWQPANTQNRRGDTLDKIAFDYAQRVEQWVDDCFGWGEDHEAHYVIPARSSPGLPWPRRRFDP